MPDLNTTLDMLKWWPGDTYNPFSDSKGLPSPKIAAPQTQEQMTDPTKWSPELAALQGWGDYKQEIDNYFANINTPAPTGVPWYVWVIGGLGGLMALSYVSRRVL